MFWTMMERPVDPDGEAERRGYHIPRSLMLNTPGAAVDEALLCFGAAASSLGGLDERPWTAESTLERGDGPASVDMVGGGWI